MQTSSESWSDSTREADGSWAQRAEGARVAASGGEDPRGPTSNAAARSEAKPSGVQN